MTTSEFDMLMQQFGISQFITPLAVPRFLPSHMRSLGARMIEVLFDNDVLVNSAGSILHITRRCLGHKSCETTQRYISIKCSGDMPTKIGCVSHVDQSDMIDGSFVREVIRELRFKQAQAQAPPWTQAPQQARGRRCERATDASQAPVRLIHSITVHCTQSTAGIFAFSSAFSAATIALTILALSCFSRFPLRTTCFRTAGSAVWPEV